LKNAANKTRKPLVQNKGRTRKNKTNKKKK
jgi:hypothetical protein